jgi:hypothetical protein
MIFSVSINAYFIMVHVKGTVGLAVDKNKRIRIGFDI